MSPTRDSEKPPGFLSAVRRWADRLSLRYRLPLSYAAVTLLAMLVLGGILIVILDHYYSDAERAYLAASAERAVRILSATDWQTLSNSGTAEELQATKERTQALALLLQLRVEVVRPDGTGLIDSGSPTSIDPSTWKLVGQPAIPGGGGPGAIGGGGVSVGDRGPFGGLPSPVGPGLFAGEETEGAARSRSSEERPLSADGKVVATVRFSEGPAYGATVIRTTLTGWLLAGVAAVLLAAVFGWFVSRRITRPVLAITAASDSMAAGDLAVRTEVHRADELGRLAQSFNVMAGRVQQNIAALQRFVADAAHELGTPLTALEADLDLIEDRSESEEQRLLARRALGQAERLGHLSTSLLQLSRLDTGATPAPPQRLDLVILVRRAADIVASAAEQAGIDLVLSLPETPVWVRGYPERLASALGNLTDNALKFTPSGGSIAIGLVAGDGSARVSVRDTGIGIPPGDVEGLFGRFHRGRNASSYPGSGLGLAIVKATMDLHGGKVHAVSSPEGSQFDLVLPLVVTEL